MKYRIRDIERQIPGFTGILSRFQAKATAKDQIGDGTDQHKLISPALYGHKGNLPIYKVPTWTVTWEVKQMEDGPYAGVLVWTLMGATGVFPVTAHEGTLVGKDHAPDYFESVEEAEQLAGKCEAQLREDIHIWFHGENRNEGS